MTPLKCSEPSRFKSSSLRIDDLSMLTEEWIEKDAEFDRSAADEERWRRRKMFQNARMRLGNVVIDERF